MTTCTKIDRSLSRAATPVDILQTALAALNERNISRAVDQFADDFTFNDYALHLQFRDKGRLTEFFQKAYELFPDTVVELVSTFECGDYAIAEWKLTATQIEQFGSRSYRFPIVLRGSTIVQIENGRVAHWSDYYDELTSRRGPLRHFLKSGLSISRGGSARLSPPTIPHRRLNRGLIEPSCQIRRGVNHNDYQHH